MKYRLAAWLVVTSFAAEARAQVAACQNRRADNIPVHYVNSGNVDQCRDYWVILGFRLVQNSTPCPSSESIHPAHQECGQTPNPGTNCVREGDISIFTRNCACVADGGPLFGSLNENCECEQFLPSGSLEDYETVACVIVDPPQT